MDSADSALGDQKTSGAGGLNEESAIAAGIVRHRLLAQQLWGEGAYDAGASLRSLLAVQAQEHAYARWTLAQRCRGQARDNAAAVDAALSAGTILRTHVLRPTWHFVLAEDLRWLMTLSGPRLRTGNKTRDRQLGLDAEIVGRSNDVLGAAVDGGRHLTRDELAAELERAGLLADTGERLNGAPLRGQRLGHLVFHAEMDQVLVSGVPRISESGAVRQTYALFDERVPALATDYDRDQALAELTRRYFSSRGPTTVKDCAVWSGLTQADIRRGLAVLAAGSQEDVRPGDRSQMQSFSADGYHFIMASGPAHSATEAATAGSDVGLAPPSAAPAAPRIDLIQCYDEYVMGYTPTRHYLGGTAPASVASKQPSHVVLLDGRMIGNWQHTLKPESAVVSILLHRTLGPSQQCALDAAIARYETFLGRPVTVDLLD
ncbi:winged helix DNA-binding domain-containing protein [Arthrobacter crystallopoietes]|uniref:Winged helix DNA-binding domain-containing protein n=1 Tax=Crystallibacter crystallopoietes TaxID=37928 RepID=A0A1H1H6T2_9MICC|nr:winged helix DNA-binding domain-containing protein [Arthrobacter crystallopoietes]SDR21079.1 Winged helix DNA-binding domain-containing protein [Arthrobacter crystallopoietes]